MESTGAYTGIFPETFKLLNKFLVLQVRTASVETSVNYMKHMHICAMALLTKT